MKPKRYSQMKHAKRRFLERYGMRVHESDLNHIKNLITSGQSKCVETQTIRVSLHDIEFRGETCRVAYDKQRQVVVTVLPREVIDAELQGQVQEMSKMDGNANHPPGCRLPDTV